jgi:hypothetical protein
VTAQITAAVWLAAIYLAPSIVAAARRSERLGRIVVLDVLLGWSVIGWFWALALAAAPSGGNPRDGDERADALIAELLTTTCWAPAVFPARDEPTGVYVDGTYLISAHDEARTWAVCESGRWGVVYEHAGLQLAAVWVTDEDIPVAVRAQALRPAGVSDNGGGG